MLYRIIYCLISGRDLLKNPSKHELLTASDFSDCPDLINLVTVGFKGLGHREARLDEESSFKILIIPKLTTMHTLDSFVQVRLIGTTILAADVNRTAIPERYSVKYTIRDPGVYRLQVRISWLTGADFQCPSYSIYAETFLKSSIYPDCTVYNREISLNANSGEGGSISSSIARRKGQLPPLCTSFNQYGRWVRLNGDGTCPEWACIGSPRAISYVNDLFGFNSNYVWSPWSCRYRFLLAEELEECLLSKGTGAGVGNVTHIRVIGDSLAREHFQNLIFLLAGDDGPVVKKLQSTGHFLLQLPRSGRRVVATFNYFTDGPPTDYADYTLWNVPVMHYLLEGNIDLEATFIRYDSVVRDEKISGSSIFYLHPQQQREDPRVERDVLVSNPTETVKYFASMTPLRQGREVAKLRRLARERGAVVLDGQIPTMSRWESSWDGIHYSMVSISTQLEPNATCPGKYHMGGRGLGRVIKLLPGISKDENGHIYWCKHVYDASTVFGSFEGGVSRMLTMMWLNSMCQ